MARRSSKPPKEPQSWERCPDAESIADDLIEKHHEHLKSARIECHFTNRPMYDKKQRQFAKPSKIAGFSAYLANKPVSGFFAIVVDGTAWNELSEAVKQFVIDDVLCGLDRNDKGALSFKPSLKVHADAVRRHGLVTDELKMLGRTVQNLQPTLSLEEGGITEDAAQEFVEPKKAKKERREVATVA